MVRYSKTAAVQGNTALYVPRSRLPTDEECAALFAALEDLDQPSWGLAMRLVGRSGVRWGELIALRPPDIDLDARVVHVRQAVEQPGAGPAAIARRALFQTLWVRAADAAGRPMTTPLTRSAGCGQKNKCRRWTGAAKWTRHDLRHVAPCWTLFDLKLDPAIVADKLGHADSAFAIKRYVGVRGDADQAAKLLTEDW